MFLSNRFLRLTVRFALISLITIALVVGWGAIAYGQLPTLPSDNHNSLKAPDEVSRHGEYETASIRSPLDGKELFEITSPTIFNRDNIPEGLLPVEVRAEEVNERLWRVFYRTYMSKQLSTVTIATLQNQPILQISDAQSSRPIRLVTVTEPDADFNGKTSNELAQDWQTILQTEVDRFTQLATPEAIAQRIRQALQILLGLLFASAVICFLRRILTRRQQTLESLYQKQLDAMSANTTLETVEAETTPQPELIAPSQDIAEETQARAMTDLRSQFFATLQQQFSVKRRLEIDKF